MLMSCSLTHDVTKKLEAFLGLSSILILHIILVIKIQSYQVCLMNQQLEGKYVFMTETSVFGS